MIVEFMGLPASGKSTIAATLVETLRRQGVTAVEPRVSGYQTLDGRPLSASARRGQWALAMARQPRLAIQMAPRLVRAGPGAAASWLGNTCHRSYVARSFRNRPEQMVVISEGPLHALAFAAAKSSTPSKFTSVVRSLPLPDILVILELRPEVAVARARNRAGKPELRPDEAPRINSVYPSVARAIADEVPGKVLWCDS